MALINPKSKRGPQKWEGGGGVGVQNPKIKNINQLGRIGVLMGGPSTEREISLKSGEAVYEALRDLNIDVIAIDIKIDDREENIRLIRYYRIDCVFIALHGRFGEDGQIQEILDNLNIPYTGSGSLASKLAMDKIASRKIFEEGGLRVPRYKILDKFSYDADISASRRDTSENRDIRDNTYRNFSFPLVVKPAMHGSSIGLSIVDEKEQLQKAIDLAFTFDERILIEDYINGREVTVGILDDLALPVIEIVPKKRFFDYEAKYQPGLTKYIVPARLEEEIVKRIQSTAALAHKLLGCFGFSRADMILSTENIPYILEINSIPGLTSNSLLPKAARTAGIQFGQLCLRLIELAYEKTKDKFAPCPK